MKLMKQGRARLMPADAEKIRRCWPYGCGREMNATRLPNFCECLMKIPSMLKLMSNSTCKREIKQNIVTNCTYLIQLMSIKTM